MAGSTAAVAEVATLADVLAAIKARRVLLACVVALGTLAGATYALLASPEYTAAATLVVREGDDGASGAQALLGQLGGLAALGGVNVTGSSTSTEYLAWLGSRQFAQRFIERQQLMPRLFESKWDTELGDWRADVEPAEIPSAEDAWRLFDRDIRSISQDKRTGLVTLRIRWRNPSDTARWTLAMVEQANEELRARAIAEADNSLEFLRRELARAEAVELQQAIYRMMEVQIKRKVLANSRPDFAFSIIDPPVIPDEDRYSHPNRPLIVAASLFASLFVGLAMVFVLNQVVSRDVSGRVPSARGD